MLFFTRPSAETQLDVQTCVCVIHVGLFVDVCTKPFAVTVCAPRSFHTVATVRLLKIKMCARSKCFMRSNLTSAWLVFTLVIMQG